MPSPALTKAILVNAASDLASGDNVGGSAPNFVQGWGLVNLASAFDATVRSYLDQSEVFDSSGDAYERSYTVSRHQQARAASPWCGPTHPGPCSVHATGQRPRPAGRAAAASTYRGNNLSERVSRPTRGADVANNVEAIVFPAGTSGTFDLDVIAANLAGDGVPGVGGTQDQDFALVVSNAAPS